MINKNKLTELLKKNWTQFIDKNQLFKRVLIDALHMENLREIEDKEIKLTPQTQFTITDFSPISKCEFEILVEFTIPKEKGILLGNHTYTLTLDGQLTHKESSGSLFI